ncbi:MAG: single-stranded DNA-binding protein [Planctomycetota bacterium]
MPSFNRVVLLGNLTRDPEVRYTPSGTAVCDLGLAVSRSWFDKASNTRKEETTFIDVTLWARTAEVAGEHLAKGRPVFIEGRLTLDEWQDKQTGQKRTKLKVIGETMQLLGKTDGGPGGVGHADSRGGAGPGRRTDSQGRLEADFPSRGGKIPSDEVPF